MSRLLLAAFSAILLLVPATASGGSSAQIRGTVAAKLPANGLVRVDGQRIAHLLRVPGSQARIRLGQRVELRGKTLRERGIGSRVLARNVVLTRSVPLQHSQPATGGALAPKDDDELELKGTLTSLSPLTVTVGGLTATCAVPSGRSLAGFAVGDFVEITCDLKGGVWVLRELEHEDDDEPRRDDDDNRGPGNAHGDDDNSGPGNRGDDNSGPGNGDDDDDDDSSGSGNGDDDEDDSSGPGGGDDDD